jgi:hypothetical protein
MFLCNYFSSLWDGYDGYETMKKVIEDKATHFLKSNHLKTGNLKERLKNLARLLKVSAKYFEKITNGQTVENMESKA